MFFSLSFSHWYAGNCGPVNFVFLLKTLQGLQLLSQNGIIYQSCFPYFYRQC